MSSAKSSLSEERELFELKKKAMQYYLDNGVPQKMEDILNNMFYDDPNDVFGHIANYFEKFAKHPTIKKLEGRESIDSRGLPTVQTDVFCQVKNKERLISSSVCSTESHPLESARQEDKDFADEERQKFVSQAVDYVNNNLTEALRDMDPCQQQDVDQAVMNVIQKFVEEEEERLAKERAESGEGEEVSKAESPKPSESPSKGKAKSPKGKNKGPAVVVIPDEPRELYFCGCNAISSVSQSVCLAGAAIKDVPLYQHIASLRFDEVPEQYRLPQPMVTIVASGRVAPGKLNCVKEYMIVPKPGMPLKQSIKHMSNIYNHCAKSLCVKAGLVARNVTDSGALFPAFDRVEQGLDMLQEAITHEGLTPGEDFHIALNCAAHEIFDYDKGKYEVMVGQQKSADDLVDFWPEILTRYPSVIAIIDPMRKVEKQAWMRLGEKISERCYVIGDHVYHRAALLKEEEVDDEFKTSAILLKLEHMNTLSDLLTVAKRMEDAENQIMIGASLGDTQESFLADLAVGCNARFLKLGAPCRGEKVSKLNRLLQIEAELEAAGQLAQWEEHHFPMVKPPTPLPEEGEDGAEGVPASPTGKK